jgi:tetratricopeptide (TPR) repeat protein
MKFFALIALLLPHVLGAQLASDINLDSLEARLPQLKGRERVDALNEICISICVNVPERGLKLAEEALQLATQSSYELGQALAIKNMGLALYTQKHYDEAEKNLEQARDMLVALEASRPLGYCYMRLGNAYFRLRKVVKAAAAFDSAAVLLRQADDLGGSPHL